MPLDVQTHTEELPVTSETFVELQCTGSGGGPKRVGGGTLVISLTELVYMDYSDGSVGVKLYVLRYSCTCLDETID